MGDIVGDGTFHICRHLKYTQIYILVVTIRHGDRIHTIPVWYSFMIKRTESDYNNMFSDLKYYYRLYYNEDLTFPRIRIDQERATFNSIQSKDKIESIRWNGLSQRTKCIMHKMHPHP